VQTGRAPQRMFGFFHVPKVAAEMDDARHVRFGELNLAVVGEASGHER